MAPKDAPSLKAMMLMGHNFKEFDSNSTVMIVVEGQQKLGEDAHRYYDSIIDKLQQDPQHIQHIQDFWGDPLTAAGAQSADAKGAYVMLNLAGEQGTTLANESVQAVRKVVEATPAPPGVKAYVTGPAALTYDQHVIGNASMKKITLFTLVAIAGMLLLVYRSIVTTLIQLFLTGIALQSSRGFLAVLGNNNIFGLTTFASNILTMLAIAAATDYGIFIFGRYREARGAGQDRETAYYTTFRSVAPVIMGSGLTIAGATYCLSFCAAALLLHDGCPVAIGMLVLVAAAITLGPAVLFVGSLFGLFESKRAARGRLWRRVGTAVVRWPAPILAASCRGGPDRHGRPARIYDELQRPLLPARQCPGQSRIRRCRPPFHPGPDESRHPDGRRRPRHAQSGRHAGSGQGRQKRPQRRGYRHGPGHHPALGNSDSTQLDTVS